MLSAPTPTRTSAATAPRLGFLGLGWIGRHRLDALVQAGAASVAAVADPAPEALAPVREGYAEAFFGERLEELLEQDLDGVVIATPSALHASQSIAALERGIPVFCQKPLGRTGAEARRVVDAARTANKLLGVDMCYRHTSAMRAIRELVVRGDLGRVYAADLVFHNAFGPDKAWFYDRERSGGGCVSDLGIHLVDLASWMLGGRVEGVRAALFAGGERIVQGDERVEDAAEVQLDLDGGRVVRIACSWNLHAGRDAVIEARFHGTEGGAAMTNVDGSFYDFRAERYDRTRTTVLAAPPDPWSGRAIVAWAERLRRDAGFDPDIEGIVEVTEVLDRIYGR